MKIIPLDETPSTTGLFIQVNFKEHNYEALVIIPLVL
jgi:hypothetical protein